MKREYRDNDGTVRIWDIADAVMAGIIGLAGCVFTAWVIWRAVWG